MNLVVDLGLLTEVRSLPEDQIGIFRDIKAMERLMSHITLYHRYGGPGQSEYHTDIERRERYGNGS